MRYKALFCDIDGTLIENKAGATLSPRVINAVHAASEKVSIAVATSRPYEHAKKFITQLHINGPCVVNGGAKIVDSATNAVLREHVMSHESAKRVIAIMERFVSDIYIDEEKQHVHYSPDYQPVKPLGVVTDYQTGIPQQIADQIVAALSTVSDISITKIPSFTPNNVCVLASHPQGTKQHGVLEVAQIFGVSTHEIIGIGDGYNDFPLLMACGLKVAMGNAVPGLKAIADYVAPTASQDGVADVIEKYILASR